MSDISPTIKKKFQVMYIKILPQQIQMYIVGRMLIIPSNY